MAAIYCHSVCCHFDILLTFNKFSFNTFKSGSSWFPGKQNDEIMGFILLEKLTFNTFVPLCSDCT